MVSKSHDCTYEYFYLKPCRVGYSATFSERNRGIVNLYIVKEDDDEFEDEMDAPIERVESNSSSEVSDTEAEDGFEMED